MDLKGADSFSSIYNALVGARLPSLIATMAMPRDHRISMFM